MQYGHSPETSLDLDPNSSSAAKEWKHLQRIVTNFIDECGENAPNNFRTLVNSISYKVYGNIEDCAEYDAAIEILTQLYIKTPNEIFARRLLTTRRQKQVKFSLNSSKHFGNSARTAISKMLLLKNTVRNWSVIPSSMEYHIH